MPKLLTKLCIKCFNSFEGSKKQKFCSMNCRCKVTACPKGHEYTKANTLIRSTGKIRGCRICENQGSARRRAKLKEKGIESEKEYNKHYNLLFNHSITLKEYKDRLSAQNGKCANPGCELLESDNRYGRLQVDHDHSCCNGRKSCPSCQRGLLCGRCNRVLGMVKDSHSVLTGLVAYLSTYD